MAIRNGWEKSMLLETEKALPRQASWRIGACALVALTLAAAACTGGDHPPSAAEGGNVNADAAQNVDARVSAEGSTGADVPRTRTPLLSNPSSILRSMKPRRST
jgi:hypothetical protein